MDPVQRLVLECGAQSMAMVGLTKKDLQKKGGTKTGRGIFGWQKSFL